MSASSALWERRWAGPSQQAGQGIVEYGLILSLIAVVAIVSLTLFGTQLSAVLAFIAASIDAST